MKFKSSHSGLESPAPIGQNPASLLPAPHLQVHRPVSRFPSEPGFAALPSQHTFSPVETVLTPLGGPIQMPPLPEALAKTAVPMALCWVSGAAVIVSTLWVKLVVLGQGSQAHPLSVLAAAPWRLSWGWRAAVSSSPSRSTAFCICRCVGQAQLWGGPQLDTALGVTGRGGVLGGAQELWVPCPQLPGPGEGQGGTEHSRWSRQSQAEAGSPFPRPGPAPQTPVLHRHSAPQSPVF